MLDSASKYLTQSEKKIVAFKSCVFLFYFITDRSFRRVLNADMQSLFNYIGSKRESLL